MTVEEHDVDIEELHDDLEGEDDDDLDDIGNFWEMQGRPPPKIFSTDGVHRLFQVDSVMRAGGNFRPSYLFHGHVTERDVQPGGDAVAETQVEADKTTARGRTTTTPTAQSPSSSGHGAEGDDCRVVEVGLGLALRYEPASPKFQRLYPGRTSYRLRLSRGVHFLFTMRGLQDHLVVDPDMLVVRWDPLWLGFACETQLAQFVRHLKYVTVAYSSGPLMEPLARLNRRSTHPAGRAETAVAAAPAAAASATTSEPPPPPTGHPRMRVWLLRTAAAAAAAATAAAVATLLLWRSSGSCRSRRPAGVQS